MQAVAGGGGGEGSSTGGHIGAAARLTTNAHFSAAFVVCVSTLLALAAELQLARVDHD